MKVLGNYINGNFRTTIYDDGTMNRETKDDDFIPSFASNMDIKICNKCSAQCQFCHEGSTPDGKLGDILNEKFIDTLHEYQEVAIGGGNVLEHPDLLKFLRKLKSKNVITNITLNQIHFEQNQDFIAKLVEEKLIYGLGISLVKPTMKFIELAKQYPNAVIHVINGVVTPSGIESLANHNLKLLILGYKHLRRGNDFFVAHQKQLEENQKWLYENLDVVLPMFKVVSFDNLALEQLDVKRFLSQEEWDEFHMGADSEFTYYIDMVERKFAKSSTAPMDQRYDLMDSVDDMFEKIRLKK